MVLDFCSTETQEGRLLHKLLELHEKEGVHGMSAVGRRSATHGMGGVGETTTLSAICYEEKVKKAFPDGTCFYIQTKCERHRIQQQLKQCIYNFGGVNIATKMEELAWFEVAVNQAARWLRKKHC